jgi:uncharacterized protein (TIGR02246 family)
VRGAWNAGDGAAWAASFAENADFVDIRGADYQGRAAIQAGHQQIFDTIYKGSQIAYHIDHVRFVRSDVASAFLHARLRNERSVAANDPQREAHVGSTIGEDQARPTMILAKTLDRWEIVAFQNTRVAHT